MAEEAVMLKEADCPTLTVVLCGYSVMTGRVELVPGTGKTESAKIVVADLGGLDESVTVNVTGLVPTATVVPEIVLSLSESPPGSPVFVHT